MNSFHRVRQAEVRIQFVIGSLGNGGAESQLLMLMLGLARRGVMPHLFVLEAKGPLRKAVEAAAIPIIDGGYDSNASRPLKLYQLLRAQWRLLRQLHSIDAQVVHGFLPLTNLMAAVAGRLAATPLIVTSRRALNKHQDRVVGWRYLDRLSGHLSHVITANAEAVRADTLQREGGDPEKIHVIYNGLDAESFYQAVPRRSDVRRSLGLEDDHVVVIIVANLIPYKGHAELIDALMQLFPQFSKLRLLVVGEDRGIGDALKAQAERLGVGQVIQWLGLRRDIPDLLAASDIYVSASHEEGFSNSLLEALAAGKAVVATSVGGNPEMLEQGDLGLLVEPRDADGLAGALSELIVNPALREKFGKAAAERVAQRYGVDLMVEQYLALYLGQPIR